MCVLITVGSINIIISTFLALLWLKYVTDNKKYVTDNKHVTDNKSVTDSKYCKYSKNCIVK